MTIIALWRCPDCGWTRSGEYGGKCRNAFAHESIDAPKVERVEYVPADDHRWAVAALETIRPVIEAVANEQLAVVALRDVLERIDLTAIGGQ